MTTEKPMTCKHCLEIMDDFRRGTLSSHELALVQSHLDSCHECSTELESREALGKSLHNALVSSKAPTVLSAGVLQAIASSHPTTHKAEGKSILPWILTAAAVIVAGVYFTQVQNPELQPVSQVAMNDTQKAKWNEAIPPAMAAPPVMVETEAKSRAELSQATPVPGFDTAEAPSAMALQSKANAPIPASFPAPINDELESQSPAKANRADFKQQANRNSRTLKSEASADKNSRFVKSSVPGKDDFPQGLQGALSGGAKPLEERSIKLYAEPPVPSQKQSARAAVPAASAAASSGEVKKSFADKDSVATRSSETNTSATMTSQTVSATTVSSQLTSSTQRQESQ